ncbi:MULTISPECIES: TetR/AcrR family transcriptional regulator [Streptomyces]|uniref:TetR/AcrR family transcriptional regulator n=1 Tax=Streptomyces TaxID=1883 RepID=UPI0007ED9234|nr:MULTISPECIES: TetR/AcrR family transcriptional regulator [unclassified Streptomyces]MCP3769515.1 TetR/AcrR family transcriptional regulator [Streptomyces sp. MAR25Y5]OBQ48927.1 transcriptional regulator [Streptomyces sp. H-KF8]
MGRPRAFDTDQAVRTAAALFAAHGYEGTSVDDLVTATGIHRGSLYKVFGSKRSLHLTALRTHLDQEIRPAAAAVATLTDPEQALAAAIASYDSGPAAGLLLLSAAERAPHDPDVAALVAEGITALEEALRPSHGDDAPRLASTVLGARLRLRAQPTAPKEH